MPNDMLEKLKQQFNDKTPQEREMFFTSAYPNSEFSNSQFFFYIFSQSKLYKLHRDGEFSRLCHDMQQYLGNDIYTQLINNLQHLREQKVQKIKNEAPEFLTHTSNIPPQEMGKVIFPKNNLNQFGEKRDDFVFATESTSERDFYALRINDAEGRNINWKKRAFIDGKPTSVFIMEGINENSYTYFLPKEKFSPVVSLDGHFGHEWTATEPIAYTRCEKNNIEEICKRNVIKIVIGEKFRQQDNNFYKSLNNPHLVIETLEKSGVINQNYWKMREIKNRINKTQNPPQPPKIFPKIEKDFSR